MNHKAEKTAEDEEEIRDADFEEIDELSAEKEASAAEPQPAPAAVDATQSRITELQAQAADYKDKYLRSLAEFENYKKRALKERAETLKYQGEKILFDLLDVVDNFERALAQAEQDPASLKEGVPLVHKLFVDILKKWEVVSEGALGRPFDPNKHRALSRLAVDNAAPGTVVGEMRKGYSYRDRLLRAAEVVVATSPQIEKKDGQVAAVPSVDVQESTEKTDS